MATDNIKSSDEGVKLTQAELDELIEKASARGARKALIEMGLMDDTVNDLRTLRGLAKTLKTMQHTFVQTMVRWLTIGMLVLFFAGISGKLDSLFHLNNGK